MKGVAVVGAMGRMGREIIEILEQKNIPVRGQVDKVSGASSLKQLNDAEIDVVIDFSSPDSFVEALGWSESHGIPFVSGTTGLGNLHQEKLKLASSKIPCLWSANMSLGVYFLNSWIQHLAKLQDDFDFQIEEIHHKKKIDKPSGTALLLQNSLQSVVNKKLPEPLSIRGGGVFGNHKILAMSDEEILSFEHVALNRKVFAKGAVRAALWLKSQEPGLYTMKDVFES
jgi:4-hydroxy-tetrahydrodipicolinate reductase